MTTKDIFLRLRLLLDTAGVPFMLTESFASSLYGTSRATQDIDIVIDPTHEQLVVLLDQLSPAQYYVNRATALEALSRRSQFNVIDFATGWKIDFIIRKPRDFSQEEFARRSSKELFGAMIPVVSPEDSIISKLEWGKLGTSRRQLADAAGILRVQGDRINLAYIVGWVAKLG